MNCFLPVTTDPRGAPEAHDRNLPPAERPTTPQNHRQPITGLGLFLDFFFFFFWQWRERPFCVLCDGKCGNSSQPTSAAIAISAAAAAANAATTAFVSTPGRVPTTATATTHGLPSSASAAAVPKHAPSTTTAATTHGHDAVYE